MERNGDVPKLTNKDLDRMDEIWLEYHKNGDTPEYDEEYKSLKVKLEEDLEKAEKLDFYLHEVCYCNTATGKKENCLCHCHKLEQENKQLKEDKEKLEMDKAILGSFKDDVEATFFMNDIDNLEDLDKKHNNLKQKLEKIKALTERKFNRESYEDMDWQKELKEILEEK